MMLDAAGATLRQLFFNKHVKLLGSISSSLFVFLFLPILMMLAKVSLTRCLRVGNHMARTSRLFMKLMTLLTYVDLRNWGQRKVI